jgi:hypothetical protein
MAWRKVLAVAATAVAAFGVVAVTGVSGASADPGGNNTTFKIHSLDDSVDDNSNEPHIPCGFKVEFFGFDLNQQAAMEFTVKAPSGSGVLKSVPSQSVSDDAADGGSDADKVFVFDGAADFDLSLFAFYHPHNGYHVELTVTSDGLPSGVKHKVFWLQCANENPGPCEVNPQDPACVPPPCTGDNATKPECTPDPCDDLNSEFDPRCTQDPCDDLNAGQNPNCDEDPCNDVFVAGVAALAVPAAQLSAQCLPVTPSPSETLPVTGNSVGPFAVGTVAVTGLALIAGGAAALLLLRRRRITTE